MRAPRLAISLTVLAAVAIMSWLAYPAGATELVGTGTIEVVSTRCVTLACNTVADAACIPITYDGGSTNSYAVGTRVRVKATDDVMLGNAGVTAPGTAGATSGIPFSTSPEVAVFGSTNGVGMQPSTDAGASSICCRSSSGTPTATLCPVLPGLGGR